MNRRPNKAVVVTADKPIRKVGAAPDNGRQASWARTSVQAKPGTDITGAARKITKLTIRDLGWTKEEAMRVRAQLATFAPDWDDPAVDIYNES